MPKKLSPQKVTKIMNLLFHGWSQTEIEKKYGVDQTTISKYAKEFKALALEEGIMAAAEEFDVEDTVEALLGLSAELKKNGLTVEEAKAGLKLELLFHKLGIKEQEYPKVINACKRMKEEGFMVAAIKLAYLEETAGMTYEQVLTDFESAHKESEKVSGELKAKKKELTNLENELASFKKQKATAETQLQSDMQQLGVDSKRLQLVEHLAKLLKDKGVSTAELETNIEYLQMLNKTSIGLALFLEIVNKTKLVTAPDHGQGLLKALSEYGGLTAANAGLEAKVKVLKGQVAGLEQQAELKGKLEVEVGGLKAEKARLLPKVADLQMKYQTKVELQQDINLLAQEKAALDPAIGKLKDRIKELDGEIEIKAKTVSDLGELEAKRTVLIKDVAALQTKFDYDRQRWQFFQSFLSLVQSTSEVKLKEAIEMLPGMVESLSKNPSLTGVEYLRNVVLQRLAGNRLFFELKCRTCGAIIITDSPEPITGYKCPNSNPVVGDSHEVITEKCPADVLKAVLKPPPRIVVQLMPTIIQGDQADAGSGKP